MNFFLPDAALAAAHAAAWAVPLLYGWSARQAVRRPPARAWSSGRRAAIGAASCAGLSLLLALATGTPATGPAMLLLVCAIAAAIVAFSRRYLDGEQAQPVYLRALFETLAAVSVVIATSSLLLLALAWACSSVPLRRLLLFYGERPAARAAARKMLVFARIGDALVVAAVALLAHAFGTFDLQQVAKAAAQAELPEAARAAAALLALGVLLKSAQLPFHGWLIQVMEAPTPVSALLHAGVVNLGGFVLLQLAPLVDRAPLARELLVVVGAFTAAVAALVATTRISIKVALAWSTCAQMGFMLVECGMGWWAAAFVHLIAHSFYKAHAFLASGNTVRDAVVAGMAPPLPRGTPSSVAAGSIVAAAAVLGAAAVMLPAHARGSVPGLWLALLVLAWVRLGWPLGWSSIARQGAQALGLAGLAFALHEGVARFMLPQWSGVEPPALAVAAVAGAWMLLCAVQLMLWLAPRSAWSRALYPWIYGGLHLDAWVNRLFALWPVSAATGPARLRAMLASTEGVRQ